MLFILMIIINLLFTNFNLVAAEVIKVFEHPVKMFEKLEENYVTLLENGEVFVLDRNNETVSRINLNAQIIRALDSEKFAVVTSGDIYFYNIKDIKNIKTLLQPFHKINTKFNITAIANEGQQIYFGTKTGTTHTVRINETTIHSIPGSCKTTIVSLAVKNNMLVVASLAEYPKLVDLKTGFLKCVLIPNRDLKSPIIPTREVIFNPGYWSMDVLLAQGNEILIFDASTDGDSSMKRLPKRRYDLSAPVLTVRFFNGRFICAGLHNNTLKIIDTARTDKKGEHVILTRTGYLAGSVITLMEHPSGAIMLGAGRNIYMEYSNGAGKVTPVNTTTIKAAKWVTLILRYEDQYKTEIKQDFLFPDFYGTNTWTVPEGTASISTTTSNVEIESNILTIEGAVPVSINIKIIEPPDDPEKPQPIIIKVPDLKLIPAEYINFTDKYQVSVHKNTLMVSEKDSCRVISLPEIPYLTKTASGKVLTVFKNKIAIYSCYNGEVLYTIPFSEKVNHLVYSNDTVAAATTANTVTIFDKNKIAAKIILENDIRSMDLSVDGKYLLITIGRMVRQFNAQTGIEIPLHTTPRRTQINNVAFSPPAHEYPSARYFVVYTEDGIAKIHDGISGLELKELNLGSNIDYIKFFETDKLIIHDVSKKTISCINITTGTTQFNVEIEGNIFTVLPDAEIAAFVNKTGQIILKKKSDELFRIGLTEKNAWYFTSRGDYPVLLFESSESLVPLFTKEDGKSLSREEIKIYRAAKLPL